MKHKYLLLAFLLLSIFSASSQTTQQEMFANIEKSGGVYYAYPTADIIPQTPAPKGYQPFYISHYGRHGSRYLINDNDYKWVLDLFEDAKEQNALTPLGIDVCSRLEKIWAEAEGHGGDLAPLGVRQHRGIAERMYQSYPQIFSGNTRISARSTIIIRCILSMDAFCERLKELNPKLQITQEASNKYMNYLNFHTKEANEFTSKGSWKDGFHQFEQSHTNPNRLISSLFSDSNYVHKKVNASSLMRGLYWIASDMQNVETHLSLYDIFEKQELFDLWQSVNYGSYICDATSALNNGLMLDNAKPLLKNILDTADEIIASKTTGATLRFGHDGDIIPLAALLHLQGCYTSIDNAADVFKVWSNFKISPMAANIQMVFFRKNESDDILVKFLLNEKETLVPTIKSDMLPYYHWNDVEAYYRSLLVK